MDTEVNTMFDFCSFYDRIAKEMPDDCKVCEVGVADGRSALYLAGELHRLNKKFKLYMVDNMDYGGYIQMRTIYQNIIKSGLGEYIEVVPYASVEASRLFNDGSLHFCYIDASHEYEATKDDIKAWYPKVLDGYKLAGHDYFGHKDVKEAVDEIIPYIFTRDQLNEEPFEPEQMLNIEGTDHGYGLWFCVKDWYKKLNP